jgi:hypothetical protein
MVQNWWVLPFSYSYSYAYSGFPIRFKIPFEYEYEYRPFGSEYEYDEGLSGPIPDPPYFNPRISCISYSPGC